MTGVLAGAGSTDHPAGDLGVGEYLPPESP